MSSLADSFLEDLDELSSGSSAEEEETNQTTIEPPPPSSTTSKTQPNSCTHATNNDTSNSPVNAQLYKIASLKRSEKYLKHIHTIRDHLSDANEQFQAHSMQKDSEEYHLVVTSNDLMVQIDDEIAAIHRFLVEMYAPKFPELDSLVPNALDYARVVERIGNETDMTLVDLASLLPSATVMSVSVTGSTTSGKPLSPDTLEICIEGCRELFDLEKDKVMILEFVESRMRFLAPNVAQLVGTRIAAQLVGLAGGILELSRIPSCNLQVLGQQKKVLSGFSSAAALRHTGIIFHCDLIQNVPPYLRIKACRALAGKLALCARVDSEQNASDPDGQVGARFHQDLVMKMEKWQEPHKAKSKKALPVPDEKPRRKRGGKRYRKLKERLQMTDVRKELNRRSFATADEEYGDNAMGITAGRLGQEGSGNLRILRKEQKQMAKKLKAASFAAAKQPLSGLSSSLAFTPVQGIELMNPEAASARVREANKKYFSAESGFVSVVKRP
uniref:U4/U6 small nuclear ribonucleoprotein Prp31 putativ n=1 Tax=Albugo laibachii Nc14 TaxID=890382 RepID=F0WMW8_9STRA|nr:U4/U6 small nuclear ribonucleoprotein Prp31 putativ [Albugo laibachii Nc14]|eukprot:CCA22653.1 U4/U6 small nuclear ribonucleoprotein Prp31 putativ [Albugo laibachii Nc14]